MLEPGDQRVRDAGHLGEILVAQTASNARGPERKT